MEKQDRKHVYFSGPVDEPISEPAKRFVTRELTVREMIYLSKATRGDFEAQVDLVESRLVEPILDLRDWAMSDFRMLADECIAGVSKANIASKALVDVLTGK